MKKIITITALTLCSLGLEAQPASGNPGGSPTPFGFTEVLLMAGAALGGKKAFDKYKKKGDSE